MRYKRAKILLLLAAVVIFFTLFLKYSQSSPQFIWKISGGGSNLFPLLSVSAIIDSINPCAFSILLLTIAFLFSLGTLREGILKIGGMYILGVFVAYLLIGLGLLQVLHLFNTPHFMGKLGAIILIGWGAINLLNEFIPSFPIKPRIPQAAHGKIAELMKKSSVPAVFSLGLLVGVCEFPCTGGPYLMALGLLHDRATYLRGLGYLIWYNILFVLPLVVALLLASDSELLEKVQAWKKSNLRRLRLLGGMAMVVLGVVILFVA